MDLVEKREMSTTRVAGRARRQGWSNIDPGSKDAGGGVMVAWLGELVEVSEMMLSESLVAKELRVVESEAWKTRNSLEEHASERHCQDRIARLAL